MKENTFKLWAIVELFGHQKMAGHVTEQSLGVATFLRIDVPETPTVPAFTRILNPSAIYAINPVTEEVARITAQQLEQSPINSWDVKKMHEKLIALNQKTTSPNGEFPVDEEF